MKTLKLQYVAIFAISAAFFLVGPMTIFADESTTTPPVPCTLSATEFYDAMHGGGTMGIISSHLVTNLANKTVELGVANNTDCSAPVSLAVYKVFVPETDPAWLSTQVLFAATPVTLMPPHAAQSVTVALPACKVQIYSWFGGAAPTTLLDSNPYSYPNVPFNFIYTSSGDGLCQNDVATSTPTTTPTTTPNTSPTITILGDNPFTLNINTTFTDPGATATDTEDGDITSHIIASSTVATTTIGTYAVLYTVTDSGGLTASSSRTVTVVDPDAGSSTTPTVPVVLSGGGSSSGGGGGSSGGGGGSGTFISVGSSVPVVNTSSVVRTSVVYSDSACILLNAYLRYGYANDPAEVVKLQAFLARTQGADVNVNGVFDLKTLAGVNAFQTKYLSQVMGPWGASQSSGYVYITTKKEVNQIACNVAFVINPAEQAVIDAYKVGQLSTSSEPAASIVPTASTTPVAPINNAVPAVTTPDNASTSPLIGLNNDASSSAAAANTATAIQAFSVFDGPWNFFKNMFGK